MRHRTTRLSAALMVMLLCGAFAAAAAGEREAGAATAEPIDLNAATAEGLTAIPGIGRVMADRIVQWREEHGPFQRVEDLLKVKGVGEKTFDKLRPYIKVGKSR